MNNPKQEIVKTISKISGKYSEHEIFTDWVKTTALSIQNSCMMIHNKVWEDREQTFIDINKKYTKEEQQYFPEMLAWLTESYEQEISDVLGEIFMSRELGSNRIGQFFTPFNVSMMTGKLLVQNHKDEVITLNEPSCGSGGMIVAVARCLKDEKINYQKRLQVVAQDLDWRAVYMCYVQLSLLGISATVVQGDTLLEPYSAKTQQSHILYTPAKMGALL